jgi:hypothetical protein
MADPLDDAVNKFLRKLKKDAKNVPLVGKHVARIGRVAEILSIPCNRPIPEAIFAVTASLPDAIGFALFTLFKPTKTDYLISRFGKGQRHKPAGGGGGHKRGLDFYKGLSRLFQLNRILTQTGRDLLILRTIEYARLVGWYLTIVEATTAGLVRWVSQSYRLAGCDIPAEAGAHAIIIPPAALIFGGAWLPVTIWSWQDVWGTVRGMNGLRISKGKSFTVTFSIDWHPPRAPLENTTIAFRLVHSDFSGGMHPIEARYAGSSPREGGGTRSYVMVERPIGTLFQAFYLVQYFISGGPGVYVDGGYMDIQISDSYEELVGMGLGHDP